MTRLLLKLPWYLAAPGVVLVAGVFAWLAFAFTGDYFHETCTNERNPLTGEFEPSNCGEGAKVAKRLREDSAAPPAASGTVVATGTWRDGDPGHKGSGKVELQRLADGSHNIFLSDFSVTNGPDLFVVLSTSTDGTYSEGDLVVEKLKANNGNQNYPVPAGTDVTKFRSAIIWCRQFRVTFAMAPFSGSASAPQAGTPAGQVQAAPTPSPTAAPTQPPAPPSPTSARPDAVAPASATAPAGQQPATTLQPTATEAPQSPTPLPPSPTPPPPTPTAAPQAGVLRSGSFRDGAPGHTGSGRAELQRLADGSLNLFLSGFSVTNGPDLYVVLTRSANGDYAEGDLILGRLRANNGSQNYAIPAGADLPGFGAVLIWCRQFDVNFAFAPLGGQ